MKEEGVWYYSEVDTPVGKMVLNLFNDQGIRIDFGTFEEKKSLYEAWAKKYVHVRSWEENKQKLAHVAQEIRQYFAGERTTFSFPYVLYGTEFQKDVWHYLVEDIGFSTLQTYKDVAEGVQRPKASRAVGGAVNKNPLSIVVPCHRVVGSSGALVGYGGGLDKKEALLQLEEAK
ncbi:MAG TPA: methylated-DNA--[protein]-cysteine S-methyltransferase [Bacillota bacterium]|nr:methylated-DNA--[protein]-cysteine S-methyltransferase [Bacillota bacterium]